MTESSLKVVVTRKDHACDFCGATILKDTESLSKHGLFDGSRTDGMRVRTAFRC